jgi:hypothetical protein
MDSVFLRSWQKNKKPALLITQILVNFDFFHQNADDDFSIMHIARGSFVYQFPLLFS